MITVTVTSDSSVPELRVAERTLADLIKLAIGKDMEKPTLSEIAEHFKVPQPPSRKTDLTVKIDASDAIKEIEKVRDEISDILHGTNPTHVIVDEVFNATELAEAEELGKPVCSTVAADPSPTAHVDTTVNTSLPEPTSVFGQAAQTTANVANPVAPVTEAHAIDANGLTWDSRIHSSSKELNKDGTWRKRRGVNTDLVTQVEAELRGVQWVSPEVPTTTKQAIENQTQIPVVSETSPHHDAQVTVSSGDMTFSELLDGVTKAMVAGQLTQARINEALSSIGVQALPHLIARIDLIPAFRQALGGVV